MAQYLLGLKATALRRSYERGIHTMYQFRNPFGYDESVLHSDDDFEPYGFDSPRLAEVPWNPEGAPSGRDFRQVIEAAALTGIE